MNEHLRDRILRKLEALSDERGYQVLDYAEFLESQYAERASPANVFTRFTETVEDKLRAGKVSASAIAETVGFMNRAAGVLTNAMEAGKNMASGITSPWQSGGPSAAASAPATGTPGSASTASPPAAAASANSAPASSPAHDVEAPGSSGEKL
jgi:hypothetical protein